MASFQRFTSKPRTDGVALCWLLPKASGVFREATLYPKNLAYQAWARDKMEREGWPSDSIMTWDGIKSASDRIRIEVSPASSVGVPDAPTTTIEIDEIRLYGAILKK